MTVLTSTLRFSTLMSTLASQSPVSMLISGTPTLLAFTGMLTNSAIINSTDKIISGISVSGNYAEDGWNSTYLRGIQVTDHDGVASFETIFPGHYDDRATHTHLLAHMNVTVYENQTIANGNVTHIGQLFWNEVLRSAVEEVRS